MSIARYLSKLGALLNSNGQVPASTGITGLAASATTDTTNASNINSGTLAKPRLPTGAVLQVQQTVLSSAFSSTSSSYTNITGLAVNITPISSTSKILVLIELKMSGNDAQAVRFQLTRNGTAVGSSGGTGGGFLSTGNDSYFRPGIWGHAFNYVDNPGTTSAVTYQVQGLNASAGTFNINQANTSGILSGSVCCSTITVLEVAA